MADAACTFLNLTTVFNHAGGQGGALHVSGNAALFPVEIRDSILWWNYEPSAFGQIHVEAGAGLTVRYCCVQEGWPGIGNIDDNPLLTPGYPSPYVLKINSPCIDAGSTLSANVGLQDAWTIKDMDPDEGILDMGYHAGPVTPLHLDAFGYQISAAAGGAIPFRLYGGMANAHRHYFILGSLSGTSPGLSLPPGWVTLPLNWDFFTDLGIHYANTLLMPNFKAMLDGKEQSIAQLNTMGPLDPSAAGLTMHFAYLLYVPVIYFPYDFASNPLQIEIVP